MKRYLLFDLDGTLTDPKIGITTCVQYALSSFGIEEPDLDKLEPFIGPPLKDSFMDFYHMSGEQAEAAVEKYRERFRDTGIFENRLYVGVPEMLRELKARGMHLAVASSKPTVFVERILEHFRIAKYFQAVVGSELDGTRVSKDEVVEEALKRLFGDKPVERDQVYMIGDRRFDAEGARAQGVESVCVTYGYGSMEELKEARADYIVRSVEELKQFLLRGTDDLPQGAFWPRFWLLLYPFLLFGLVRSLGQYLTVGLLQAVGNRISGAGFFYLRDAAGGVIGFTGNAVALIAAAGFAAGTAAVWRTAKRSLGATDRDMELFHRKKEPVRNYILLVFLTVGAVLGLNLLFALTKITGVSESYQAVAQEQHSASLLAGLIAYGLISPFAEEILFRGVFYGYLRRMVKPLPAMFLSAALFGIYHGNVVQGIYGFLMGLLIAYVYEYFGEFRAALAVHVIANVIGSCLSGARLPMSGVAGWTVCAGFLVMAAASFWLLSRQRRLW